MTTKNAPFAKGAKIETSRYRGPDRRTSDDKEDAIEPTQEIRYDAKGNPVLEVRTDVPRRREGDDTVDLLKCLDNTSLELADDSE